MMKKSLSILLGFALILCFSIAGGVPVLTVTDPVVFPCTSIDEDGYAEDSDSAHVHVWHEDAGDNAITYSARTSDMTADWIGEVAYAGGKNVVMFRDVAGDIDAGAGDGNYTVAVHLFVDGQRFPTYYNFYLSGTNTNGTQDDVVAIKVETDGGDAAWATATTTDVTSISGDSDAADSLELRLLRHDAKKITDQTDLLDFDANDSLIIERADNLKAVNTTEMADDVISASKFADDAQFANYGGAVWVDTANGTAGTVVGVNGIPTLPVKGFPNAKTIADAIGVHTLCVLGGGDQAIRGTMNGYTFMGIGDPTRNKIDLNSQDVGGSMFIDLDITGIQGGDRAAFIRCALEDASLDAIALDCSLRGDITLLGDRDNVFIGCVSSEPGDKTPSLIFSGGSESVQFRGYSGGLHLYGMGSNDSLSFDCIGGQLQIGAGVNVNAKITARGMITLADSTAGLNNLTYAATAQYAIEKLAAMGLADSAAVGMATIDLGLADSSQVGAAAALVAIRLDHLISTADDDAPVDGSIIAHIVSTSEDWSTFAPGDDALQSIRDRGDAAWTTGGAGSFPDSANNYLSMMGNRHPTDSTYMDSMINAIADANKENFKGGSVAGESSTPIYIFAVDTLNDVRIDGVNITMYKAGSDLGSVLTANDTARFNGLDGVTTYTFEAFAPLFIWETGVGFTCSAPSDVDSIMGYPFSPTALSNNMEMTTLWDYAYGLRGDTLANAKIKITMNGSGPMRTSTRSITRPTQTVWADVNGYWTALVFGTDSTFGAKTITIEVIKPGQTDASNKFLKVTVPANGSTTHLRDLLK
jgi:hypothetical protein